MRIIIYYPIRHSTFAVFHGPQSKYLLRSCCCSVRFGPDETREQTFGYLGGGEGPQNTLAWIQGPTTHERHFDHQWRTVPIAEGEYYSAESLVKADQGQSLSIISEKLILVMLFKTLTHIFRPVSWISKLLARETKCKVFGKVVPWCYHILDMICLKVIINMLGNP